ncbi:MAG: bifunctional hydroxymethylpyrimidine kinase/phosphomethylpyrimidine kinase [Dermatophilaceae bacterium]|nr:bifunctional hydroxymethylpyrimidine kinase/phosphomethylpyrimidine kinase [Dermatophilaceae bacterium]
MRPPPVTLTVAGSDSGGGAGIQADLATFAALGVHGTSAVTAVTVQDTVGVHAIHPVPADVVVAQVTTVVHDLAPHATKTGMLGDASTAAAVSDLAAQGLLPRLVVDPVLVSTSGHALATDDVLAVVRDQLLPHAAVVTPNTDEAAALLGCSPATSVRDQTDQARRLLDLGCAAAVVTGGVDGGERVDVLATPTGVRVMSGPQIDTRNDHGTGCTFAAAVAAGLAHGLPVDRAVTTARAFVRSALTASACWRLGRGRGPVSHLAPTTTDPRGEPA